MKTEKPMEATATPAPAPPGADIPRPPVRKPDRDEKEYLEWRQELL